jgi:hypothetical protein
MGLWTEKTHAQVTVDVGPTTVSGSSYFYGPVYRSSATSTFHYCMYSFIYTSSELSAAGITSGSLISDIQFSLNATATLSGSNTGNIEVWIQNSAATNQTSGTSWGTIIGSATQVVSTTWNNTNPGAAGYKSFPFSSAFTYTGGSLIVSVRWTLVPIASPYASGAFNWQYYSGTLVPAAATIGSASGSVQTTSTTLSTTSYGGQLRPLTRMTYTAGSPCSGTPSPGNTIASPASVCSGASLTLTLQNSTSGSGVSYQWQSADDAAFTTNVQNLGTNPTQSASQTSAKYYRCLVTCTNSGQSTYSNPVLVNMNGFTSCYCIPTTTNGCNSGDHITKVSFASLSNPINNSTGTCISGGSYSDYKYLTPAGVTQGDIVSVSVEVNNGGTEYAAGWIDYNQNGTFDASEYIALTDADGVAPWIYNGTITIPLTANVGTTGMRFRSRYASTIPNTSACDNTFSYGETEDYLINIALTTACNGTPAPGNTISSVATACVGQSIALSLQNPTTGTGVTYDWQSSPDGSTWTSTGGTSPIFNTTQSSSTYYQCIVTCTNSGQSTTSNPVQVTQNAFYNCYCTTGLGGSCGINALSSVAIATTTLNNVTGGCTGTYNSFPASGNTTATLLKNTTYSMTVGCISGSNTQVAIWIDYNQDGVYSTSEYTLINGNVTSGGTGSGNFTIPGSALSGTTGMRVRSDWTGAAAWTSADACANRTWGETEDYTITIVQPGVCAGTPNPGNTVASAAAVCSGSSVSLSLQTPQTDAGITFQWESADDAAFTVNVQTLGTGPTETATITSAKYFRCLVTCTNSSQSVYSTPVQVTLSPFYDCYCASGASNTADEEIYSVTINGASTPAAYAGSNGCTTPAPGAGSLLNRYSNFKSLGALTTVQAGQTVNFTVQEDECDGATYYYFGTAIWIDFNHDGVFSDATEKVFVEAATAQGPRNITNSFVVPVTALSGLTAVRVTVAEGYADASLTSCLAYGYGETEDYLINIIPATNCSGTPSPGNTVTSAQNVCSSTSFTLSLAFPPSASGITYDWQSSPNGTTWTSTGGTSSTYTTTQAAATYYQCIVTCTFSGQSIASTPILVTQGGACECGTYCVATNAGSACITNVTLNTLNNTTTCNSTNSYYSYQSATTSLNIGSTYTFSLTCDAGAITSVWFDWNNDQNFTADEWYQPYTNATTGSVSVTVPVSAYAGVIRMRVRSRLTGNQNGSGDACLGMGSGETEDYCITLIAPAPCSGISGLGNTVSSANPVCPTAAFTLTMQNQPLASGINYQWQTSPDGTTWTNAGPNSPIWNTSQTAATYYQCIATCTADNSTATSNPVLVGLSPVANCYCVAGATTIGCVSGDEYVGNFTFNTINNTTSCPGTGTQYTDYTAISTSVQVGQTYTASVLIPNWFGGDQATVWIDFNQNGSFADAGEQFNLTTGGGDGLTPLTGDITIPGSALTGTTRIRVRGNYTGTMSPCGITTYGEVEDYSVSITPPVCLIAPISPVNGGSGCPDALTNTVTLSWPTLAGATGYDVYFGATNPPTNLVSNNQPGTSYNAVAPSAGTYYWMVVPQIVNGAAACNIWSFSLSPAPSPVANSGGDVCFGNDITLSGDNVASGQSSGNTYQWSGPNGYSSSAQNPTISAPTTANSGTYTVVVTNQYNCTASASVAVDVNPNPSLSIASVQNVGCVGGSDGILNIAASNGTAPYDFTTDFVSFNQTGSMTGLPAGPTIVYVSDANGCQSQITGTLTAISSAPPAQSVIVTPTIIGFPAYACPGTVANLSIPAVANATQYIWDGPPGTYFNGNPLNVTPFTTTTPNVQITFGTPGTSLYSIGVQAANGCGASLRKVQKARYSVSTPVNITGNTTTCANTSGTYSTPAVDAATQYYWSISGDATVTGNGTSVTVNFGPNWNGGNLCVAAQTTCFTSPSKCITIGTSAAALGAISGTFTACPNSSITFSVPASSGAASYSWTLPTGATGSSTTNSINVNFGPTYSSTGNICVSVTSICGVTSAQKCKTVAPGIPSVPASIAGITNGVCGQTVSYSTPASAGTTYNWSAPGTITGNGNSAVNVQFGTLTTSQVCVTASNSCGTSAARCIPVKGAPNSPSALTAVPSSWCANTSGIEFTANTSGISGAYTLSWTYPSPPTATYVFGGGNSNSLILDWGTGNGTVIVNASNACGTGNKAFVATVSCKEGELAQLSKLNVYPNPTAGVLNVEYTSAKGTAQITVLDLSGRVVMTQTQASVEGQNTMQLDLSKVAKGAYMLNVQTQGNNNQVRVVVE